MNTSLLVEKLQARGIKLSLDNGQLSYNAENPIPTGTVTTLTVEESRLVRYLKSRKTSEIPEKATVKTCKSPRRYELEEASQAAPLETSAANTVPSLPWQLKLLLRAAASNLLPTDTTKLPSGLVPGLNRYTLAVAAAYLVGDRDEALVRLWQVYRAWHPAGISLQGVN